MYFHHQPPLIRYAAAHRDPRNIALHCWGVPMVMAGICLLLMNWAHAGWAVATAASGFLLQAVGHWYEGRRSPLGWINWALAPVFVGLQAAHQLGWAQALWDEVEQRAGPRRMRDLAL